MLNSVPWYIGLRYIRSKRRNGFIAFVSVFAFLGMLLGVFALIVVLSVMNGFDAELKQRILRVVPHGFVSSNEGGLSDWQVLAKQVNAHPDVVGSAPFIETKALLGFGSVVRGVQVYGVSPEHERDVSDIGESMLVGQVDYLMPGEYGLVLGSIVARHLGVSTGDRVTVTLPVMSVTPAGVFPRTKRFTVVGVFEVGAQVDQTLVMMHIQDAQKLKRSAGKVDGLRLKFSDMHKAPMILKTLLLQLGDAYHGKDWSQTQGSLFQAVRMEKIVVAVMLGVIIAIAAFNIVTSLIMMVTEKRSDIAVLRTLGLTRQDIVKVFMVQGSVLGIVGVIVGAGLGVFVAHYLSSIMAFLESLFGFQVFDANVYFVTYLPSVWEWQDTFITCGFAVVVAFLATIYPAFRAASVEPAEALRYDT